MRDEKRKGDGDSASKDETASPLPAAGPHAKRELTNPDATPGAGALPDPDENEIGGGAS